MKNFIFILLLFPTLALAVPRIIKTHKMKNIRYQSDFGYCPDRLAGDLNLILVKEFEKNFSLKQVKEKIIENKLAEKYFLSEYKIKYNPLQKLLRITIDCPEPLMKVQIYKPNATDVYYAILAHDGKLYDASYEDILRKEGKLSMALPLLAFPVEELDQALQSRVANLIKRIELDGRRHLSEVIVSQKRELTMIFSYTTKPTSIFLGQDEWDDKVSKLQKILNYMEAQNKFATVVNITNPKKVVVKF